MLFFFKLSLSLLFCTFLCNHKVMQFSRKWLWATEPSTQHVAFGDDPRCLSSLLLPFFELIFCNINSQLIVKFIKGINLMLNTAKWPVVAKTNSLGKEVNIFWIMFFACLCMCWGVSIYHRNICDFFLLYF